MTADIKEKGTIKATVTFTVKNGAWNDGSASDKAVTLTGKEGDTLKLAAATCKSRRPRFFEIFTV